MRANFLRLKEILSSEFPGQWSGIDGANYPVPEWTKLVMNAVSAMQMFVMVLVLVGDSIWSYVPGFSRGPPEIYYKMKDNPAMVLIVLFLVVPSYVQSFVNSGGELCIIISIYINHISKLLLLVSLIMINCLLLPSSI